MELPGGSGGQLGIHGTDTLGSLGMRTHKIKQYKTMHDLAQGHSVQGLEPWASLPPPLAWLTKVQPMPPSDLQTCLMLAPHQGPSIPG